MDSRRLPSRSGHSLIEVLIAAVVTGVVFMATMAFMRTGNQQVVKVSDHAQARLNAMKVLERITEDLMRCVVNDNITDLVTPVHIEDGGHRIWFRALHHRRWKPDPTSTTGGEMTLVAQKITYERRPVTGGKPGYFILRNGAELKSDPRVGHRLDPVADLTFKEMDGDRACQLGISPFHAIDVQVSPRGDWDVNNKRLAQENVQGRVVHLSDLESQFACLVSFKKNAPAELLATYQTIPGALAGIGQLDMPWGSSCPLITGQAEMAMDWLRPPGLVEYDDAAPFDDQTADKDE